VKGWAIPIARARAWHYFTSESDIFNRFRSACDAHTLISIVDLEEFPTVGRTPLCERCVKLAPPLPAVPAIGAPAVPPGADARPGDSRPPVLSPPGAAGT